MSHFGSYGEKATALCLVHVNENMNFALASLFNFIFAAATFILFGLAVALSRAYPRGSAGQSSSRESDSGPGRRAHGGFEDPDDLRTERHHAVAADHGDPVTEKRSRRIIGTDPRHWPGRTMTRLCKMGGTLSVAVEIAR